MGWRFASRGRTRRDFHEHRGGAAILEFALVAAPFLALLIAILETALTFYAQQSIQTATETAARSLMTGATQSADATASGMTNAQLAARFKTTACAGLPTFLSCSKLLIDVEHANTFTSISTAAPRITFDANGNPSNNFIYDTGAAGDIVIIRLMYLWPVSSGPLGFSLANVSNNTHLLIGTSVAKTEPYA